jgi:hypothetical protein
VLLGVARSRDPVEAALDAPASVILENVQIAVRRSAVVDKRDLLLFDQLHILGLERRLGVLAGQDPAAAADVAYLAEEGIAMEVPETSAGLADLTRYLLRKDLAPILEGMNESGEIDWPTNDGTRRDQLIQAELLASSGRHPAARFAGMPLPRGGEVLVAFRRAIGRIVGYSCS